MLYAKRHYEDGLLIEETMQRHTKSTLNVLSQVQKVFPELINRLGNEKLSGEETAFLTVSFHDMGKCAKQFQTITLNPDNKSNWNFRHEILSCEFINLLDLDEETKRIIQLAILGHHEKNINILSDVCYSESMDLLSMFGCANESKREQIYKDAHDGLKFYWKDICEILKFIQNEYEERFGKNLAVKNDFESLGNACDVIENYKFDAKQGKSLQYEKILFLKGILVTCDHLGSAHADIKTVSQDIEKYYLNKFELKTPDGFRTNQKKSITKLNSILISPTGSGKTEAAMLWANELLKENKNRRIFYVLPYTASINGMYDRLQSESFGKNNVDMKHGKAAYSYFKEIIDKCSIDGDNVEDLKKIEKEAKLRKQTGREICKPIKIVTPHQIIKAFYKVKGYESLLTEFCSSLFIFDEIHCYSDELMAMIIVVMNYIRKNFGGKLFFMSATFPDVLKNIIEEKIEIKNEIRLPKKELKRYARNKFHLIDNLIENKIDMIKDDIERGKRVLVVCNTIKKAQQMYKKLAENFDGKSILLLHSYFAQKDREKIEKELIHGEKHENGFEPADVLVGTQAIEISLDLDFDVLYTEMAPIDALAQRFGRVYRRRPQGEYGTVNIFTKWDRGTEFIYGDKELNFLQKTLDKLKEYDSKHENMVNDIMLQDIINYIYDDKYKERIESNIKDLEERFERVKLIPLLDYSRESEEYFEQFDGIKICPECYLDEYKNCLNNGLYIEASAYLVSISERKLMMYLYKNNIFKDIFSVKGREQSIFVANESYFDYDAERGLIEKENIQNAGVFL